MKTSLDELLRLLEVKANVRAAGDQVSDFSVGRHQGALEVLDEIRRYLDPEDRIGE